MSIDIPIDTTGATPPAGPGADRYRERGTWSLSWTGVRTVAVLELRQRLRSTRWKIALVVWFVVVGGITLLTTGAMSYLLGISMGLDGDGARDAWGPTAFGIISFFVLFLGLLVAPTLTAPAVNGDRNAGTLATLQVTLLTPVEIVVGKLLAAWVAALAFLVASVPFILWALLGGGLPFGALVGTLVLLAVILGVVCAIGLAFSSLTTKTSGSALLTYLTLGALTVVCPVLFGLTLPLVSATEQVRTWDIPADYDWESTSAPVCEWTTHEQTVMHTERTWWLLAANPFVIVADAMPLDVDDEFGPSDPMSAIQYGVRLARTGPGAEQDWCTDYYYSEDGAQADSPVDEPEPSEQLVWPWGVALYLVIGAGAVVVAVRRLRIPSSRLPRGTRVA